MRRSALIAAAGAVAATASAVALTLGIGDPPAPREAVAPLPAVRSTPASPTTSSPPAVRDTAPPSSAATPPSRDPQRPTSGPPPLSVGRYVRDLPRDDRSHASTMQAHGCADARAGSRLVLLELGVQTVTSPRSHRYPGVLLTGTFVRLSYAQLRAAVTAYLQGFARCASGRPARIALGTNSDGEADRTARDYYAYADRGRDWYDQLVGPLTPVAAALGLEVVGALDLEVSFSASAQQAEQWERSYLAQDRSTHLIENGSLDACPEHYRPAVKTCGAVVDDRGHFKTWTIADYLDMALRIAPGRIELLPQIYTRTDAAKWAALDRWSSGRLLFAGALTERASCPEKWSEGCFGGASLPPREGWMALHEALSGYRPGCPVPALVDLQVDPLPPPQPRKSVPRKPGRSSRPHLAPHRGVP